MLLSEAILERRSIRKYKDTLVNEEMLMRGIELAIKAPSAHNRQPWKVKILSLEEKDKVADVLYSKTKDIVGHTGPHTAGIIREVPNLIMIFIDNDNNDNRDMDIISIGAFTENLILTYTDMGLGTLWIGNTNIVSDEIKDILGVSYETVSCVGVGYADQEPKARPRKDIEDILI